MGLLEESKILVFIFIKIVPRLILELNWNHFALYFIGPLWNIYKHIMCFVFSSVSGGHTLKNAAQNG